MKVFDSLQWLHILVSKLNSASIGYTVGVESEEKLKHFMSIQILELDEKYVCNKIDHLNSF